MVDFSPKSGGDTFHRIADNYLRDNTEHHSRHPVNSSPSMHKYSRLSLCLRYSGQYFVCTLSFPTHVLHVLFVWTARSFNYLNNITRSIRIMKLLIIKFHPSGHFPSPSQNIFPTAFVLNILKLLFLWQIKFHTHKQWLIITIIYYYQLS